MMQDEYRICTTYVIAFLVVLEIIHVVFSAEHIVFSKIAKYTIWILFVHTSFSEDNRSHVTILSTFRYCSAAKKRMLVIDARNGQIRYIIR